MRAHLLITSLCFALGSASAGDTPDVDKGQVVITGMKNPDMRSYRATVAGLDAFDKNHHMAPLAPEVRFRMRSRKQSGAPAEPLALRIVGDGDSASIPLAIDADGYFTVPRIEWAYDSNADLVLNQKKGKFRALPEVRTPGLPDNVRRLGDLRLECRVKIAIGKYEAPFWVVALVNSIMLTGDWCGHAKIGWTIATAAKLAGATLVDGDRKLELKPEGHFEVPIGDKTWPDETRIELRFAELEGEQG
jgi:hypothetical protein